MPVIETVPQMIEHLRICEAAAVTQPTKGYYRRLREWLEELEGYQRTGIKKVG